MPPVSPFGMDPGMAGFAQGNQVVPGMGPAFRQRFLMVDLLRHHVPAVLQAQFAKRMAGHVGIPDLLPGPAEYSGRIEPPNPRVRATQSAGESH